MPEVRVGVSAGLFVGRMRMVEVSRSSLPLAGEAAPQARVREGCGRPHSDRPHPALRADFSREREK